MRSRRLLFFLIAIIVGVAGGLAIGWMLQPRGASTTFEMLSPEYQTDYVLMVAEIFHAEGDASLASYRLTILGPKAPLRMVQEAILHAGELNYSPADLDLLARLSQALSELPGEGGAPRGTP